MARQNAFCRISREGFPVVWCNMPTQPPRWHWNIEQLIERTAVTTLTGHLIDATTKKIAVVLRPLPGREIAEVGLLCQTVTGIAPTLEARLEGVTGSLPSGSLLAPTARGVCTPVAGTFHWVPLEAPLAPAEGVISVVVGWSAGTVGAAHSATLAVRGGGALAAGNLCPCSHNGTTWTAHLGNIPLLALRYRDGTLHPGLSALRSCQTLSFAANSAPSEVGNWIEPATRVTVDALGLSLRLPSGSAAQGGLYRGDGTLWENPPALLAGRDLSSTSLWGLTVLPIPPRELAVGEPVILAARGTTSVGFQTLKLTFVDAAAREAAVGRQWWVQRNGTGAWQEDRSAVAPCALRVSAWDNAGGWRRHPGMTGGLRG